MYLIQINIVSFLCPRYRYMDLRKIYNMLDKLKSDVAGALTAVSDFELFGA